MDNEIIDIQSVSTPTEQASAQLAQRGTTELVDSFRECYKLAQTLCQAAIIPTQYRGKPADVAIAVDMAARMGVSPMMVMQNLYVVQGKPSWSGQACRAFIGQKFKNVKTVYVGAKGSDDRGCYITAEDEQGDKLEGSTVTIRMAKAEGWYGKNGSKWQTMPEQMLAYRAAAFFARVHCPELLMGCMVEGEAEDAAKPQSLGDIMDNEVL